MDSGQGESSRNGSDAPVLFKRKTKGRGGSAASNRLAGTAAASVATESRQEKPLTSGNERDEDEDDTPVAVVRTRGLRGRQAGGVGTSSKALNRDGQVGRPKPTAGVLSFEDEGGKDAYTPATARGLATNDGGHGVGRAADSLARLRSKDLALKSEHVPEAEDNPAMASAYSAAALAELKASTPNRLARSGKLDIEGNDDRPAYTSIADPATQVDSTGESLARMKFAADFAHEAIPSEAIIAAAKEKRRRALAKGLHENGSEDFISLSESQALSTRETGPHPESRLQREEDELGSGEDEFAEYTGAQERVALGRDAREAANREDRRQMREAVEIDDDDAEDASDDSGREWETAQMQRMHIHNSDERKRHSAREPSPFRPASIPRTAPLPQLGATSIRLRSHLRELEETSKAHDTVVQDAERQLVGLQQDEKRNKADAEATAEKEAWFRELQEFVASVSRFLESKFPELERVEGEWRSVLRQRRDMRCAARAYILEDNFSLFHGVPASAMIAESGESFGSIELSEGKRLPQSDGDAFSTVRVERRNQSSANQAHLSCDLSAEALNTFAAAKHDIRRQAEDIMNDVQALEFRDPAARIEREDGSRPLHPASLVARFHRWRRLYPEEYSNAWGGLTLGGVWDFWIRHELSAYDFFSLSPDFNLDSFNWCIELSHFADRSQQQQQPRTQNGEKDASQTDTNMVDGTVLGPVGGDDEVVAHALTSTFLPLITRQVEEGAFDPWSTTDNRSALEVAEQPSYVLEKDATSLQSFVAAVLDVFAREVDVIVTALARPPAIPPPPAEHPSTSGAIQQTVQGLCRLLLRHVVSWHRFVAPAHRPLLVETVTQLVGRAILPLLDRLRHHANTQAFVMTTSADTLQRCARPALLGNDDTRRRLAELAG